MKLTPKLALLIVTTVIIPLALLAFLFYENGKRVIIQDSFDHLNSVNELKADELHRWFVDEEGSLKALGKRPLVREYATALASGGLSGSHVSDLQTRLADIHFRVVMEEEESLIDIALLDHVSGKVLASSDPTKLGMFKEDRPYFLNGRLEAYTQHAYYSRNYERTVSTIGLPVYGLDGQPVGVLAAHLNLNDISKLMTQFGKSHKSQETFLVNRFNFMVTECLYEGRTGGEFTIVYSEGIRKALAGESGRAIYEGGCGQGIVLGAYKWLPRFQMAILTETQISDAMAPVIKMRNTAGILTVFIMFITCGIGIVFARTITIPVQRLIKGAGEIGGGNLDYRIEERGRDEIATLAEAFNEMAAKGKQSMDTISASKENLEIHVAERTQELQISNLALMDEILERERIEASLKESEERFRELIEHAPDAILAFDPMERRFVQANQNAFDLLGYSGDELSNMNWLDISVEIQPDGQSAIDLGSNFEKEVLEGTFVSHDWVFKRSDGSEIISELRLNRMDSGSDFLIRASILDISEKKEAEKSLDLQNKLSKIFMEAMPCFAVLNRSDKTIFVANKIAAEAGGQPGLTCYESMAGFKKPCWWCMASEALATGEPQQVVVEDRGVVWEAHWVPIEEDLYLHYAFDITEKVQAEEEQKKLEEQVQHVQKLESMGVLAGGIAHDFNNLLMGVLGNTGLILTKLKPESPIRNNVVQIETAAQRGADLANQMLAFSGKGKFNLTRVNLTDMVSELSHLIDAVISKKVEIRYELDKDIKTIDADSSQVHQVIMNLVINASDSVKESAGVVIVTTGQMECDRQYLSGTYLAEDNPEGTYAFVTVADTGMGMNKKTLEKIFDPFFSTKDTGRGLGLAAVLGIIRGHQGAIRVESKPRKGSVFTVLFPVGSVGQAADKSGSPVQAPLYPLQDVKVLLVDDDETVRQIVGDILKEFGFSVLTANDGREGVEAFREHADEIDIVLLDMTMPVMGGKEAFEKMCKIRKNVRVILSSGYAEEDSAEDLMDKDNVEFIQKPYTPEQLFQKIKGVLEK